LLCRHLLTHLLVVHLARHPHTVLLLVLSHVLSFRLLLGTVAAILWLLVISLTCTLRSHWSLLLHQEGHTLNEELEIVLKFFLIS
jgi:hypothetical protein